MNNVLNKINKTMQKGNTFLIVIASLAALILISSLCVVLFAGDSRGTGTPANDVISSGDDNTIVVTDIYQGEITIPKFSYAVNTYDLNSFTSESDRKISYPGSYVGIDVSEHNQTIDWEKVAASGIDFVMIRAGYRGYTRGRTYDDSTFKANIQGATENGIKVGLYFFSQAITTAEAEEEASFVLSMIGDYDIDYPIVFDWENITGDEARTDSIDGETVSQIAAAFCNKIKKAGYNTAVYINKTQAYGFYNLDTIKAYDIWYAEYQAKPSLYYDFTMWQYTCDGTIDGIDGTVDYNISFKNYSN